MTKKLVEVVVKKGYGETLGGNITELTRHIGRRCRVSRKRARQLLSDSCERIEESAEGDELHRITLTDILVTAKIIHDQTKPEPPAWAWHDKNGIVYAEPGRGRKRFDANE